MNEPLRSATWREIETDEDHIGDGLYEFLIGVESEDRDVEIVALAQSSAYDIDAACDVTVTTVIYRLGALRRQGGAA